MPLSEIYRRQVSLLLRLIPLVAEESCFALKGGTAINLFLRSMPRLSVDLDLTYLPVESRARSLAQIDAAMQRIAGSAGRAMGATVLPLATSAGETATTRLVVRSAGVQVKVEVTPVLRGCVFDPQVRTVAPAVEAAFGFAEMQVVSFPDLYAGKIVAGLDRQHPRDLFDLRDLLANEGIDEALRQAFIVYLLSHNRPMHEVLRPTRRDLAADFEQTFLGMTEEAVSLQALLDVREQIVALMVGGMPEAHRQSLLAFKRGDAEWNRLGLAGIERLPAVRWRRQNLDRLASAKRALLIARLEDVLR